MHSSWHLYDLRSLSQDLVFRMEPGFFVPKTCALSCGFFVRIDPAMHMLAPARVLCRAPQKTRPPCQWCLLCICILVCQWCFFCQEEDAQPSQPFTCNYLFNLFLKGVDYTTHIHSYSFHWSTIDHLTTIHSFTTWLLLQSKSQVKFTFKRCWTTFWPYWNRDYSCTFIASADQIRSDQIRSDQIRSDQISCL